MITIIIIIAVIVALIVLACCKVSAMSEPYPCRNCQQEYCDGCEYWKGMVGDDSTTA